METILDRIGANLDKLQVWAEEGKPLPFIDEGHDFVVGPPLDDRELQAIEREYEVKLPSEYRAFLARFGDTSIGPSHFRSVREGLSEQSRNPFPLIKPLLGTMSPEHQRLPQARQPDDYGRLLDIWESVSNHDGVLAISDYGCAIYGRLILNGPYCSQVWICHGDTAYYGPFGGSESLHDESWPLEWTPTEHPREYSFLEWYENWLNARLQMAGLLPQ